MKIAPPLWLASRSPRRKHLLMELGLPLQVYPPDVDDAALRPGKVPPAAWVMALAYLKARRVADLVRGVADRYALWCEPWSGRDVAGTVLGADTVCVRDGEILGQPRDADDARRMLRILCGAEHTTLTGMCLIWLSSGVRRLFYDQARVRIGVLSANQIHSYVESGQWRGKAGAYNLEERVHAGWRIECLGDPTTVMGLPMRMLAPILDFRF